MDYYLVGVTIEDKSLRKALLRMDEAFREINKDYMNTEEDKLYTKYLEYELKKLKETDSMYFI